MKAVARGSTIEVEEKKLWVPFTYEKLPKMCFKCGHIIYREERCILPRNLDDDKKNQFGPWENFRGRMVFDEEDESREE